MNNQLDQISVLGPADELPAEGFQGAENSTPLDFYSAALADDGIGFEVSNEGVTSHRVFPKGVVFQQFDVGLDQVTNDPALNPCETAISVDFDALFEGTGALIIYPTPLNPEIMFDVF